MSNDKKIRVNVHLDPDIIAGLDRSVTEINKTASRYSRVSRADLVRFAICASFIPEKPYIEHKETIQEYVDKLARPQKKK